MLQIITGTNIWELMCKVSFFQALNASLLQPEQDVDCWEQFARYFNPMTSTTHHNIA